MKRLLLPVFLLAVAFASRGQGVNRQLDYFGERQCYAVRDQAAIQIPALYAAGKRDSLDAVLRYWETQCGDDGYRLAFVLLRDILERRFQSTVYPKSAIPAALLTYRRDVLPANQVFLDTTNKQFDRVDLVYRDFISDLASRALRIQDLSPLERFIAASLRSPFETYLDELYPDVFIQPTWIRAPRSAGFFEQEDFDLSVLSGVWLPTGNLAVVGSHPYVGFHIGTTGPRSHLVVSYILQLLSSANAVRVKAEDSIYNSNQYVGGGMCFDAGIAVWTNKRHRLEVLGGIGVQGLSLLALKSPRDGKAISKSFSEIDLTLGVEYRLRIAGGLYGIQAKYHFIGFDNAGGTDLSGASITLGVVANMFH